MSEDTITYRILAAFEYAIAYGTAEDHTLSDEERGQLDAWIDGLAEECPGMTITTESECDDYGRCELTGMFGSLCTATVHTGVNDGI